MANESILIVDDDNPVERELLSEALRSYQVTENVVGLEGANLRWTICIGEESISRGGQNLRMAILDLDLPDLHGFEVLKAIRQHPEHSDLPVLVLTGPDSALDAAVARELGADSFVVKPSDWKGLQNIAQSSAIFLAGKKKRQVVS